MSEHEFEFTRDDFEKIRKMLYGRAGISLSPIKRDMVYSRLSRRLRAKGFIKFSDYLDYLEKGDSEEMEQFTNALTTNLTFFFREEHHFPALAHHIEKYIGKHPVNLWCAACSTGEEAYSMAMTMVDLYQSYTPPVKILASDIDTEVLKKAASGIYELDRLEKVPKDMVKRFFLKGSGKHEGFAMVKKELRDMINFERINLLDKSWPLKGPYEAIFCRNVMIYFDKATQSRILQKFRPLLRSDGLLFAGHSENFYQAADIFAPVGKTIYRLAKEG